MNGSDEGKFERAVRLRAEMVDLLLEVSTSADTLNLRRLETLKFISRIDRRVFGSICAVSLALLIAHWFGSAASWIAALSWLCLLSGGVVALFFRSIIDKIIE